jgi:hypothetical protein
MITASRCADVIAVLARKKGEAANRRNYRMDVVSEILTGQPIIRTAWKEMEWGKQNEPYAREEYGLVKGVLVETCGFVIHPRIPRFGCSPDGLVGDDGLIQIKCGNTSTHLDWMLAGKVPEEHAAQMLAEMACTGRQWCDFVSFDPRIADKNKQLFICRWQRDENLIRALEVEIEQFSREIDEVLARLPKAEPQPIITILDRYDPEEHLLQ